MATELRQGDRLAVAFELEADTYTGGRAVLMVVRDVYQIADPSHASAPGEAQGGAETGKADEPVSTGHSGGASNEFQF